MSRFSGNWTDSWPTLRKFSKSQNHNLNNFKSTQLFFDFSTALVFLHQAAHFKTIGTFLSPKLPILENDRIFLGLRKIFKKFQFSACNLTSEGVFALSVANSLSTCPWEQSETIN
jgi:hypothetical protein